MRPQVNDRVTLNIPENERLHLALAQVVSLEAWGAHVATDAAATGQFRASWGEMLPPAGVNGVHISATSKYAETSGECCDACGSFRMVRTGACQTCQDGGTAGGCG